MCQQFPVSALWLHNKYEGPDSETIANFLMHYAKKSRVLLMIIWWMHKHFLSSIDSSPPITISTSIYTAPILCGYGQRLVSTACFITSEFTLNWNKHLGVSFNSIPATTSENVAWCDNSVVAIHTCNKLFGVYVVAAFTWNYIFEYMAYFIAIFCNMNFVNFVPPWEGYDNFCLIFSVSFATLHPLTPPTPL